MPDMAEYALVALAIAAVGFALRAIAGRHGRV
jgi:hypothetical protein